MLAAKEKSHPGFQLPMAASQPGFDFAISNTATEFDASVYDFRGGPRSSGSFRDSETGLDYAKARYHQPGMGRFMSVDPYMASGGPANPGSWNRYAYVLADPIKHKDPRGREACDVQDDDAGGPHSSDDGDCCDADFCSDSYYGFGDGTGEGGGGGDEDYCSLNPADPDCYAPPPYTPPPAKPQPTCADSIPQSQINFVQNNVVAAGLLSAQTGGVLSGAQILGWSAFESNFGTNGWSTSGNNYFSYALGQQYSSFYSNGSTAIFSSNNYFTYNGQTGVSSLSILSNQFANGASVAQAFGALAAAGYDRADAASYGAAVVNRWLQVLNIETCLSSLGRLL